MNDTNSQVAAKQWDLFMVNLMECQEEKAMSNPVFADFCDISTFTLRAMKSGESRTSGYTMLKIRAATGVQI